MELALEIETLKTELEKESVERVFNLARDCYDLDVNEAFETKAEVIDLILAVEYKNAGM